MTAKISRVKVWDLPLRLFHWGLLALMLTLWVSANEGEMVLHQYAAYSLMTLLLFRILWGFVGSQTALFSNFVRSPSTVIAYVKKLRQLGLQQHLGHNPLGGYMVVLMIAVLLLQLTTGLFATDEIFTEGPFVQFVQEDFALTATWLHKKNFDLMLILIVMHVLAVLVHQMKGDKLIAAMLTGYKILPKEQTIKVEFVSLGKGIILFLLIAAVVGYWFVLPLTQGF